MNSQLPQNIGKTKFNSLEHELIFIKDQIY
jgi:hypothetical protein